MIRSSLAIFLACLAVAPAAADPKGNACTIDALARIPEAAKIVEVKAAPARVGDFRFHDILVQVEAFGRSVKYKFICREDAYNQVTIIRREVVSE